MPKLIDDRQIKIILDAVKEYIDGLATSTGIGGNGPGYSDGWTGGLVPINGGGTGANNHVDAFANLFQYSYTRSANGGNNLSVENVAMGQNVLIQNSSGIRNTGIGNKVLSNNNSGSFNTGIGYQALQNNTQGTNNVAIGLGAAQNNTEGHFNTAIGTNALFANTQGTDNVAIGNQALQRTTGSENFGLGAQALYSNITGVRNTAIGVHSLYANIAGSYNIAIGYYALQQNTNETDNTAVGYRALRNATGWNNITGIGNNAQVTGANQVQLGDDRTTVHVYNIQNRSDERDKANIKKLEYPYRDFVLGLTPVSFQWDMREDYRGEDDFRSLGEIKHTGTYIRKRRHNGFIAQDVKDLMDSLGFDFAGYQDHTFDGGDDVKSLGYMEFIAPMVAVIQDQDKEIKELKSDYQELQDYVEELKQTIQNII